MSWTPFFQIIMLTLWTTFMVTIAHADIVKNNKGARDDK